MITTTVLIKNLTDTTSPAQDLQLDASTLTFGSLSACVIIQAGTASGKTSVGLVVSTDAGEKIWVETTGSMLESVAGALKGAELRWADEKK